MRTPKKPVCHLPEKHKGKSIYTYPPGSSLEGFSLCRICWQDHQKRAKLKTKPDVLRLIRKAAVQQLDTIANLDLMRLPLRGTVKQARNLIREAMELLRQPTPFEENKERLNATIERVKLVISNAGLEPGAVLKHLNVKETA